MFILKESESEHLLKIKDAVIKGVPAVELTETCKEISPFIDDKNLAPQRYLWVKKALFSH